MGAIENRQRLTKSVIVISSALVCIRRDYYQSFLGLSDHNIVCEELMEVSKALMCEGSSRLGLERRCLDSPQIRNFARTPTSTASTITFCSKIDCLVLMVNLHA
jgi:hypothetical protein